MRVAKWARETVCHALKNLRMMNQKQMPGAVMRES